MRNRLNREEYLKKYRQTPENKERHRIYEKDWRAKNKKKQKAINKKAYKKYKLKNYYKINYIKKRDLFLINAKKDREKHKDEYKARRIAQKLKVPEGQLCEICYINTAEEKHHPDYRKPLEVKFVCHSCNCKERLI